MKTKTRVTLTGKTITKQQAERLAVWHTLFFKAMTDGNIEGKCCYGGLLRDIQNEVNIYLKDKDLLENIISEAEDMYFRGAA